MVQITNPVQPEILGRHSMTHAWAAAAVSASLILYPDPLGNDTPPASTRLASDEATKSCFDATLNPAGAYAVIRSIIVSRDPGTNSVEGTIVIQSHDGATTFMELAITNANSVAYGDLSLKCPSGFRVNLTNGNSKRIGYYLEYDVVGA